MASELPACGHLRRLSIQVKGGRATWNHFCGCDPAEISAKLATLSAVHLPRPPPRHPPE